MKFCYTVCIDKDVDIDFRDIYNIQINEFKKESYFDPKDEYAIDWLSDNFVDNIDYYLHRIGLCDFNSCNNEEVSDYIWQEYSDWLDNNYNPSNFE